MRITNDQEETGSDNPWIFKGNIPLGEVGEVRTSLKFSKTKRLPWNSTMQLNWGKNKKKEDLGDSKVVYMKLPMKYGEAISDTFFIVGRTNSGKSVTFRLIYYFISKVRPVIVFDYTGRDHFWSYLENSHPTNLPPQTPAAGIRNAVYAYYPVKGARPKAYWEREIRPDFNKYDPSQLERLGFADAGGEYLKNLMEHYAPFKTFDDLVAFVELFPTNDADYRRISRHPDMVKHHHFFEPGDFIPQNSKNPILRNLKILQRKGIYEMNGKKDLNIRRILEKGKSIFYSFNDKEAAKAELDYLLKELQTIRDTMPWVPRPFIFIEEAHDVISGDIADFIKVCRKLSIGVGLCMPVVPKEFPEDALADIKNIIAAKLKGESFKKVAALIGDSKALEIPYLLSNAYTGEREMMFHNGHWDQTYGPIRMYECPQEMHRETGQDNSYQEQERQSFKIS